MKDFNFNYKQFVKEIIKQMPGNITGIILQTFVDEYIAFINKNRAKKTYEGVQLVCKKLLEYFSPLRKLETIQLKDAEQFLDAQKRTAPKGVYNYHRTLRAMWNKAKQWNYVKENPFEKVKLNKRQVGSYTVVTEEQIKIITNCADDELVKDFIVTAFYTGCRLGELINLTWQDVNLKDDLLTIGNKDFNTKTRKQRLIPVHPRVKEILLKIVQRKKNKVKSERVEVTETTIIKLPEKNSFVFCKSNGFGFTGDYFSKKFKEACRKAGLSEDLHFHSLRHGAATRMINNGAPLPSVQRILGHQNIQTTMSYTHPGIEDLRNAVNKL